MKRLAVVGWVWLLVLGMALPALAQAKLGDDVEIRGNGLVTLGYQASYGDQVQSNHGLQVGLNGDFSGYYYNPNFLNFDIAPYYNQSRTNSSSLSLTNSSGLTTNANFFSGSHFPGSVNYSYNYNSTGTLDIAGTPNFTTVGTGQGFGINWSALVPDWPTLSAGYTEGSGSGNLYGTNQTTASSNRNFNLRSTYLWKGFQMNAFYTYLNEHSNYPVFLAGQEANSGSHGDTFGFATSHNLPWNGQFYLNYARSSFATDYQNGVEAQTSNSNYTTDNEAAGVNFHPTSKLNLFASESYVSNLSAYLTQNLITNGTLPPPLNLGSASRSVTMGGGAGYQFTPNLTGTAQATYYNQHYFGKTYTGTYISGTVDYNKRLLNTFTFSAAVVDSSNGQGNNALGFLGTINGFRRMGHWDLSGAFSIAQNVQSALITYTTSTYSYSANLHRRFSNRFTWTVAFNGSHSGLTNQPGTSNHSESYTTSLGYKWINATALYANGSGNSLLTNSGLVPLPPLPGEPISNLVTYAGSTYGGGIAVTPLRRLTISGTFNRAISDTLANGIASRNNTELFYSQLQYNLRRLSLQAGYTRLTQGISASGAPPGTVTSYYGGVTRWFNFF